MLTNQPMYQAFSNLGPRIGPDLHSLKPREPSPTRKLQAPSFVLAPMVVTTMRRDCQGLKKSLVGPVSVRQESNSQAHHTYRRCRDLYRVEKNPSLEAGHMNIVPKRNNNWLTAVQKTMDRSLLEDLYTRCKILWARSWESKPGPSQISRTRRHCK
jgi:hypothetical protein